MSSSKEFTKADFQEMSDAILDGDTNKAFELMQKMQNAGAQKESLSRDDIRREIKNDAGQKVLETTAAKLAKQFPHLDSGSDSFDQEAIDEVVAIRDLHVKRGLTPAKALEKAVKMSNNDRGIKASSSVMASDSSGKSKAKSMGSMDLAGMSRDDFDTALGTDEGRDALAAARGDFVDDDSGQPIDSTFNFKGD
ncbi:MAG: hypothetical protein HRU25_16965 [Psychrobium sp.]|nr:hypothetical protein [Psychrobium sp.]